MHAKTLVARGLVLMFVAGLASIVSAQQRRSNGPPPPIQLEKVSLPPGFHISLFADKVEAARQMAIADDGTIFVGSFGFYARNPRIGNVYAVRDADHDGRADEVKTILSGLNFPNGVAFRDGALYVAERHRVTRYDGILRRLDNPPEPVVLAPLPVSENSVVHSWKYLRFGPDGKLYLPIGSPCNVCAREESFGTILRMNADGSNPEVFARGIRNSVGMAFEPGSSALWFTDNGRDSMGDNVPSDELNRATTAGQDFGFPFCHQGDVPDPEFGKGKACADYRPPVVKMGPHVAAIGMTFYTGDMFPSQYKNQLFVAEHGSWNRNAPLGYRIAVVQVQDGSASGQEVFASGFLDGDQPRGRPVDLLQLPDGSLLVSDDSQGVIYRITYKP